MHQIQIIDGHMQPNIEESIFGIVRDFCIIRTKTIQLCVFFIGWLFLYAVLQDPELNMIMC